MKRVLLCGGLFFCMIIAPIALVSADDGEDGSGLLSGLLNEVDSSVKETTESVGNVVGSAVDGVDQTVKDTVSFTAETVETLADPSTEQPVSEVVDRTVDFVEGTVNNVAPVVENTTETVEVATSAVTGIVEELPEVPVVSPVVAEVGKAVNETAKTVNDTVEIVKVDKATDVFEEVAENETPVPPKNIVASPVNSQPDELVEQPVLETTGDVPAYDERTPADSLEIPESTEPIVDERTTFIPNENPKAVSPVKKVANPEEEPTAKQETPMIPIQSDVYWDGIPAALTTGSSSVISPFVVHGGNADVMMGVFDEFAKLNNFTGRQWVHSDEQMRIQWVHAPPGQPPQTTPFLHV